MTSERQEFMRLVQQGVLKLDTQCHICGATENLQLHHIIPLSNGGENKACNLLTLCGNCHGKVHNNEGLKMAREKIAQKKKGEFILINTLEQKEYFCNGWEEVAQKILELCKENPQKYQYSKIKATIPEAKTVRGKLSKIKKLYPERIQTFSDGSILIKNFMYKGQIDLKVLTTRRKDGIN